MKFFLSFLFLIVINWGYSQKSPNVKFGTVSPDELDMSYDPLDSTAEAVMLYDYENVYFTSFNGAVINIEYHGRIKIFKKSGLDRGNISLRYYTNDSDNEKIYDIEGFTYIRENGKIITNPLPTTSIFDEKVSETVHIKKIIMPNVKEGSVIEYRYKRRTPFSIDDTPKTWYFQGDIPYRWSELNVSIPSSLTYRIIFGGYLPLYIKASEKGFSNYDKTEATKYRFAVKDAPPFKNEDYITCNEDYISKVEFGIISYFNHSTGKNVKFSHTWGDIARTMNTYENFGEKFKKTGFLKELSSSFSTITDSLEKMKAAFHYMTRNFSWNETDRLWVKTDLKTVLENKKGNSGELNLLFLALLREMGFTANPVILSTRQNGKVQEEYPILEKLNYTLVQVRLDGKDILMDVTDPYLVPGLLPAKCLSNAGYVLEKDTVRAVSLRPQKSMLFIMVNAELSSSGLLKGTYSELADSYNALTDRSFLRLNNEKAYFDQYRKRYPDRELEHMMIENKDDPVKPYKVSFDFSESVNLKTEGKTYINPLLGMETTVNPFKEKERLYPVDIGNPYELVIITSLKIPEGYQIEEIPKALAIALPEKGGKYSYVVETENNTIKIKSRMLVANSFYAPEQYHYLREFYNTLIQKQTEQIVLKKL